MEIVNTMIQTYLPFLLAGLIVAIVVLLILCIILFCKIGRERKRYDIFMGTGRRPEHNLEMKLDAYFQSVKEIEEKYGKLFDMVTDMDAIMSENIQKIGLVRYNPFDEMGGNLCFALALLDAKDNGVVLNGIHSRTGSFTYAKPIEMGVSTYVLSTEELQALKMAQENAYRPKAEKVVKVKPKRIFRRKDKPLFEPEVQQSQEELERKEKIEMIGDVTTAETVSIMAEEEIAQQISQNTVVIQEVEKIKETVKETVKELVKETVIQMEKETIQQDETAEKVKRLEEQVLLLTENKIKDTIIQTKLEQPMKESIEKSEIDVMGDSVENIIERIAQQTEIKQKELWKEQKEMPIVEIPKDPAIQDVVQEAMKNAAEKEAVQKKKIK